MASQSTQPSATNPAPQELTNNDLALLLNTQHSSAVEVIYRHSTALTNAIGNDFHYFSNKFVELEFVTRTAANNIPTIVGIGNMERGRQLLELVIDNCNISPDKKNGLRNSLLYSRVSLPMQLLRLAWLKTLVQEVVPHSMIPN